MSMTFTHMYSWIPGLLMIYYSLGYYNMLLYNRFSQGRPSTCISIQHMHVHVSSSVHVHVHLSLCLVAPCTCRGVYTASATLGVCGTPPDHHSHHPSSPGRVYVTRGDSVTSPPTPHTRLAVTHLIIGGACELP